MSEADWLLSVVDSDVVGFFAELGVHLAGRGGTEARVRCFTNAQAHAHEDKSASCSVNLLTGLWMCQGCGDKGNAFAAAKARGYNDLDAAELAKRFGLFKEQEKPAKLPNERELKKWREELKRQPRILKRLWDLKAWEASAVVRLGLGWNGERITFPIRSPKFKHPLQGVACYLPGGSPKMVALPGTVRGLFPAPEMIAKRERLFLVEGEPAAVSIWSLGLKAVAIPGAQTWKAKWCERLYGREIIALPDCDGPGRQLMARVKRDMPSVRVVDIEPSNDSGYDVGDMIAESAREGGVWQMRQVLEAL